MASKEGKLNTEIMLELPENAKVFRNNVALGWQGKKINDRTTATGRTIELACPRPIRSGLTPGASDLIGWTSIEITPDMVGKKVAVFTAIEVKTPGVAVKPHQKNFIRTLSEDGGYAGIAKQVSDALKIVKAKDEDNGSKGQQQDRGRNKQPRNQARKSRDKT